jgi:hypothetical protein
MGRADGVTCDKEKSNKGKPGMARKTPARRLPRPQETQ